ncbi:hypothetical protein Lalb_Chr08g0234541 [Lupinus albus]|uniref:Uncharacterized protein n=1 Tax=Lupinus albus TaxID=3870 RepID=A0A6A4Q312_LUPAL|nr:hypothetical protein Lalb_Chr08g0234541 [Lupinus albus]
MFTITKRFITLSLYTIRKSTYYPFQYAMYRLLLTLVSVGFGSWQLRKFH